MEKLWANPLQRMVGDLLEKWQITGEYNHLLTFVILMFILIALNGLTGGALKAVLTRLFDKISANRQVPVNRPLITKGVIGNFAFFVPLVISARIIPLWFSDYEAGWLSRLVEILLVLSFMGLLKSLFRSVKEYLAATPGFRDKPLDSYLQVAVILLHMVSGIIIFTLLTGVSTWKFLGSLGAASAILMLIFKDTILGFVASIQVSVNDMVRVGDWIEMPRFQADGAVQEITLNTVKVQNWDKTISTIPTYMLVTESVKNWRGMQESGGRRIKRSLNLSSESVR
ncbi:MAG: mechanosensitive ion channel family protein, partial [Leadbetterella sp.]|nr:mechanosensitive ion channel family protein [Leadbetterella sp.]